MREAPQARPRQAARALLRLQTGTFPRRSVYAAGSAMPIRLVIGIALTRVRSVKACTAGFRPRGSALEEMAAAATSPRCQMSPISVFARFLWCYFELGEYLDMVRLLGERQDISAILGNEFASN